MKNRWSTKTLRNLLLSLGVVLVPVVVIMALSTRTPEVKPQPVEWKQPLTAARAAAPYQVLAPELPPSWTATKATWYAQGQPTNDGSASVGNAWTMAWVSPDRLYYGLYQRDAAAPDLIRQATREGREDGRSEAGGRQWRRYLSTDERTRSLVCDAGGTTTVVTGDVSYGNLEQFASTLR